MRARKDLDLRPYMVFQVSGGCSETPRRLLSLPLFSRRTNGLSLFVDVVVDSAIVLVWRMFDIVVLLMSGVTDVSDGDRDAAMLWP